MKAMVAPLVRDNQSASADVPVRVIVVGGGLAGMAAAVALESAGAGVTLVESRKQLGGRASSFRDPQTGEELDNSQHILLGCCTNLIDFYHRLGVADRIEYQRTVYFRDGRGRPHQLWSVNGLPAPLHLGPSAAIFGVLTWRQRLAVAHAMLAMLRLGRAGRQRLAEVSFGQWLDEHHQPASLIDTFYAPILTGALNEDPRQASAASAIQVFQDSMLAHHDGYAIGVSRCPLSRLYDRLPCPDVRMGSRVSGLRIAGNALVGIELAGGEVLSADAIVLATPYQSLARLIPAELARTDQRFAYLDKLQSVPILGAHLWFDRPILAEPHVAFLDGPLQWLFRKDQDGRAVHGVISAAREWVDRPREQCLKLFEQQLQRLLPAAREATLVRGRIIIDQRATFSPLPGVDRYRPVQAPPPAGIENLYLAGDYTQTGWPATMEGAVRSGYLAAEAVAGRLLPGRWKFCVSDLPVQWPARMLGQRASQ